MEGLDIVGVPTSTGTTIMAMEFDGGVVIGADSRTSVGHYVANRVSDKITHITDHIYCCRSGNASHTQYIADLVRFSMDLLENMSNERPDVFSAATQFRNYCYDNRDTLTASVIVAGWDKRLGGQVYCSPIGGMLVRQPWALGGSGSMVTFGYVRDGYREGMDEDECVEFVKGSIKHGINLDGCSGGVIRVGIITEEGMKRRIFYNTDSGESQVNNAIEIASCWDI